MPESRTILFTGNVQGVGFRMTVVHLARDLPVSGTVRNLPDGRVELVAQGEKQDIDALIFRLREHFGSYIRSIAQDASAPISNLPRGIQILH